MGTIGRTPGIPEEGDEGSDVISGPKRESEAFWWMWAILTNLVQRMNEEDKRRLIKSWSGHENYNYNESMKQWINECASGIEELSTQIFYGAASMWSWKNNGN